MTRVKATRMVQALILGGCTGALALLAAEDDSAKLRSGVRVVPLSGPLDVKSSRSPAPYAKGTVARANPDRLRTAAVVAVAGGGTDGTFACCCPDGSCVDVDDQEACSASCGGSIQPGFTCFESPCGAECPAGQTGNCCTGHTQPGCDDPACCACVCAFDSFCCETQWDTLCAGQALGSCADECACAGGVCGDASCDLVEDACTCPQDCGPPAVTETHCGNTEDDDCDQNIDCADPDCAASPLCNPPDDCAEALPIADGLTAFTTFGATTDGPEHTPPACDQGMFGDPTVNLDIWFDYTASCTGLLTASTCNDGAAENGEAAFDTKIAIYDGCACPVVEDRLQECNDDGPGCDGFTSIAHAPVVVGSCYKIRVGGFVGESGDGLLALSCAATETGACCVQEPSGCACIPDQGPAACTAAGGTYRGADTGCADGCDCDGNAVCDPLDTAPDCNANQVPDACDIAGCLPGDLACADCQPDGIPDGCQQDLDHDRNGVPDACELDPPAIVHGAGPDAATAPCSGYIDPRDPQAGGLQEAVIQFTLPVFGADGVTPVGPEHFTLNESGAAAPPSVDAVEYVAGDPSRVRVHWDRPITIGQWTTLTAVVYNAGGEPITTQGDLGPGVAEPDRVDFAALPAGVAQRGVVRPADLLRFRQFVGGACGSSPCPTCGPAELYFDIDRSGVIDAADYDALIGLLFGTGGPAWSGHSLQALQP